MKATELRIGNWVNYHDDDLLFEVTRIDDLGIGVKNIDPETAQETWIEYECFSPIPLTEEWLLKFGFERTDLIDNSNDDWTWLFYQKDSIYIDGSDLTIETATGIVIKVEYVHQLQNLYFALTGEELTL